MYKHIYIYIYKHCCPCADQTTSSKRKHATLFLLNENMYK